MRVLRPYAHGAGDPAFGDGSILRVAATVGPAQPASPVVHTFDLANRPLLERQCVAGAEAPAWRPLDRFERAVVFAIQEARRSMPDEGEATR